MLQMVAENVTDRVRGGPAEGGYFNQALCVGNMEITGREAEFEIIKIKKGLFDLITKSPPLPVCFYFIKLIISLPA
jgi:hypothetical protein